MQGVVQVDYYYLSSEKFSSISFSNKPAERIAAHDKNSVRGKTPADSKQDRVYLEIEVLERFNLDGRGSFV